MLFVKLLQHYKYLWLVTIKPPRFDPEMAWFKGQFPRLWAQKPRSSRKPPWFSAVIPGFNGKSPGFCASAVGLDLIFGLARSRPDLGYFEYQRVRITFPCTPEIQTIETRLHLYCLVTRWEFETYRFKFNILARGVPFECWVLVSN